MKSAKQKKSIRTTLFLLLTVFSLAVSTVGCSQVSFLPNPGGDQAPPTDTPAKDDIPAISIPDPPTVYYNRYTGLACDEALLSCRPISVCMGNFDGSRQEGLSYADILIEAPIDGDKTRLWSTLTTPTSAAKLSSVASVRDYMMPLPRALGAISAYAGTTDTEGNPVTPYEGDTLDYIYHNLSTHFTKDSEGVISTSGEALRAAALSKGYLLTDQGSTLPYRFCEVGSPYIPNGNRVRSIYFRYSMANTISFRYDEGTGLYLREQQGRAHVDALTGMQLSFSNLLLLFHNVSYYHSPDHTSFTLDTKSGGEGYLYTGGGVLPIHWSYLSDGTLSVKNDQGEIITVNRGKTYIGMLRVTDSATLIAQ